MRVGPASSRMSLPGISLKQDDGSRRPVPVIDSVPEALKNELPANKPYLHGVYLTPPGGL